jgi:hypothetical protein
MDSAPGAASHKPFTTQVTGRVTVYVETSAQSVASMEVITRRQLTTETAAGSVKSQGPRRSPVQHLAANGSDTPIR